MIYFSKYANTRVHDIYKDYYQRSHELDALSISKVSVNEFMN